MKLSKQCCTLEQSNRLRELGVTIIESEFAHVRFDNGEVDVLPAIMIPHFGFKFLAPAWSVAELGVILPDDGEGCGDYYTNKDAGNYEGDDIDGFSCWHFMNYKTCISINGSSVFPTEAQARAALLIYLLENNHITAEECNQRIANS